MPEQRDPQDLSLDLMGNSQMQQESVGSEEGDDGVLASEMGGSAGLTSGVKPSLRLCAPQGVCERVPPPLPLLPALCLKPVKRKILKLKQHRERTKELEILR